MGSARFHATGVIFPPRLKLRPPYQTQVPRQFANPHARVGRRLPALRCLVVVAVLVMAASGADPQMSPRRVSGVVSAVERLQMANGVGRVRITVRVAERSGGERVISFDEWEVLWFRGDRYRLGQPVALE